MTRCVRKAKPGKVIESKTQKKGRRNEEKDSKKTDKRSPKAKSSVKSQGQNKRSKTFRKMKDEAKSFQGVSSTTEKPKKFKTNKTVKKNKILAEKLAA